MVRNSDDLPFEKQTQHKNAGAKIHQALCYETIMFGRVTYARRRCKARVLSVYLTHIL